MRKTRKRDLMDPPQEDQGGHKKVSILLFMSGKSSTRDDKSLRLHFDSKKWVADDPSKEGKSSQNMGVLFENTLLLNLQEERRKTRFGPHFGRFWRTFGGHLGTQMQKIDDPATPSKKYEKKGSRGNLGASGGVRKRPGMGGGSL